MSFRDLAEQWAIREWADVKRVPMTLVIVSALSIGAGWWVAQRFYAERIEVLQLRLSSGIATAPSTPPSVVMLFPHVSRRVGVVTALAALALFVFALVNWRRVRRQRRDLDGYYELLKVAANDRARLEAERDQAVVALKDTKHEYAMGVFERYSTARFKDDVKPTVTIRYCDYAKDYELVQQIRGLVIQYLRWEVNLDGSNNPALPRAERVKVAFDVGLAPLTYIPVMNAFREILDVPVGGYGASERPDTERLIIHVLPSIEASGR